jgi:Methyltransferase domain
VVNTERSPDLTVKNHRVLRGEADVAAFVEEANEIAAVDYGRFMQFCESAVFVPSSRPPADPFSPEYREFQLGVWRIVAGRDVYDANICEADTNVTVAQGLSRPFPYNVGDLDTVARYTLGVGWILLKLGMKAPARLIEFGPGWGHVTDALIRTGFDVTVVDIEPTFLEIITQRSARDGFEVVTHHNTFTTWPESAAPFDAALFFECFHHCLDHDCLLGLLSERLTESGRVVFAAEPIYSGYACPWGVRLDGHAVWATRSFGWMELAFDEAYFRLLLARHGFIGERSDLAEAQAYGTAYIASRA